MTESPSFQSGSLVALLRQVVESAVMESWLVRCLYQEGEQRALVRALLEDVLKENMAWVPQDDV